jgi:HAD superfamily hydrolase (TIGR01549 family)
MSTRWSAFTKQVFTIGCLAALIWFAFRVRILWTPLILVFILSFLASYPVNAILRRTGWPRTLVVVIVFVLLLVLVGVTAAVVAPRLITLTNGLAQTLRRVIFELAQATPAPIELTPILVLDVSELYAPIRATLTGILQLDPSHIEQLRGFLSPVASGAAAVVISAVSSVVGTLLIFMLSFYLVKDWPNITRYALTRAPKAYWPELRKLWLELAAVWDAFARGQFTAGLVMGIMVGLILSILGVRNAMALGLLAGLAEFIPGIGPIISVITGTLIALTFGSSWLPMTNPWFALSVLGVYALLGQFQNLYVFPRVIGRRIDLHPIVIITGALAGADLLGILGLLLAAPTIATLRVLLGYAFNKVLDRDPFPATKAPDDQRILWRDLLQTRPVKAILFDLDGTLIETDDMIVSALAHRLTFLEKLLPVATRQRTARRLLMSSEVLVNGFITFLDRLGLDGLLFRLDAALHHAVGIRTQDQLIAVSGVPTMLKTLSLRYALAVVTSRNRGESEAFLAHCDLTEIIPVVITRDDSSRLKPHPMPIRLAAERLGVPIQQCVMVGDTGVDVRAAKAAGALAVGVLCGFGDPDDLKQADLILRTTAQLADCLPETSPPIV